MQFVLQACRTPSSSSRFSSVVSTLRSPSQAHRGSFPARGSLVKAWIRSAWIVSAFVLAYTGGATQPVYAQKATAPNLLADTEQAFENEQFERAVDLADSMVTLDTLEINDDVETALRVKAQALRALDRPTEALSTLDEALRRDPFFSGAYALKARIALEEGQLTEALAASQEASRLEPTSLEIQVLHGNVQFQMQSYAAAIETYGRVLNLNPSNVDALINRGRSYLRIGRIEAAYYDAVDAIEFVPERPAPYRIKAEAEFRARQFNNASSTYSTLIQRLEATSSPSPVLATALTNRGQARLNAGDLEGAIADLDRATLLDPSNAFAFRTRGMAHGEMESRDAACQDLRTALELGLAESYATEAQDIVTSYCRTSRSAQ